VPCSFHESGHLDGDVDMVELVAAILEEEARRREAGRADWSIPFRPDHGLHMTDDRARGGQPGYPLVGRHVGLAELRGIIAGLGRAA
jgi:mannonate dehydratase